MKRDLVVWAKQQEIEPADPDSFFKSSKDKSDKDKKWFLNSHNMWFLIQSKKKVS